MSFLERSAYVAVCLALGACGGKVAGPSTTETGGGTAGASGTFGGIGTGTDDPAQGTPTNPGMSGTVMVSPDGPACQAICDRIAQIGCAVTDCVDHCNISLVANSPCLPLYEAALQCFVRAPIQCKGDGVDFFGCDTERDAVTKCISQTRPSMTPTMPPPPPNPSKPIPAQCIGEAPIPPDGIVCNGGSSGGGTGGTGGGAPSTCQSECNDATNNVWSSYCVGSNCSCMYNGQTYCSCVSASPCSSCCPGI